MIVTIFHEDAKSRFPDMVAVHGTTMEELRENALQEVKKRGWNPDDCWSQVYDTSQAEKGVKDA